MLESVMIFDMPRGLSTTVQRDYAREVFAELIRTFPRQGDIGKRLGIDQGTVSKIRDHGRTSMQTLIAAAELAGRPSDEIDRMTGRKRSGSRPRIVDTSGVPMMSYGAFVVKIRALPELDLWLSNHLEIEVSEVCRAIVAYESTPGLVLATDGQPQGGWDAFFEKLRTGQIRSRSAALPPAQEEHRQPPSSKLKRTR